MQSGDVAYGFGSPGSWRYKHWFLAADKQETRKDPYI